MHYSPSRTQAPIQNYLAPLHPKKIGGWEGGSTITLKFVSILMSFILH
jgi:hypothetical protein